MLRRALALTMTVLASATAPAAAQQSNAPPGNSGIDQYLETVPESSGGRPVRRDGRLGQPGGGPVLSSAQRRAMQEEGADGRKALALVERYGVDRSTRRRNKKEAIRAGVVSSGETTEAVAPSDRGSVTGSLVRAVVPAGGTGGLGALLPTLLMATAAAGVGAVVARRRHVR